MRICAGQRYPAKNSRSLPRPLHAILGARLGNASRAEEALAATAEAALVQALTAAGEAVTRYQALAARRPLAFANDLARALTTMADVLDGLDQAEAAAAVRRRAGELGPE
jgi:hypothetical protein